MNVRYPCLSVGGRNVIISFGQISPKHLREDKQVWELTTVRITADDGREVESYGISIGNTVINDISPDKHEITEFVRQLNRLGASEIHAYDLVEDFLGRY